MKKFVLPCLAALLCANIWAQDFSATTEDGITLYYNIVKSDVYDYACEVTFGNYWSYSEIKFPNTVTNTNDGNKYTLVGIGEGAFNGYENLTAVTFPETLSYFGGYSFGGSGLLSVTIPKTITSMGEAAFTDCWNLSNITLEDGLTVIGDYAFSYLASLESITIPSSITDMGQYAFSGCENLKSVTLSEGLTTLGDYTFYTCSSLSDVNIGEGLTSIPNSAFNACNSLSAIDLPKSLITIGESAFSGSSIVDINIPENVKTIGDYAFYRDTKSSTLTLPDGLEYIGDYAFYGCLYQGSTNVTIPESVTYIGKYSFYSCQNISELNILAKTNTIEDYAFTLCKGMTSVTLSKNIYRIKTQAFYDCTKVTSFTSLNPEAPICDPAALEGISKTNCTIYVPKGSKGAYESADTWEDYTIVELEEEGETPPADENRFMVDDIYYYITDADALTCEVTFATTSFNTYSGSVTIPETVTYNGKEYNVTGIGYSAFRTSKGLTEVIIPENITTIDSYAFYRCSSLKEISIPSSVLVIGEYAFYECTSFTEIKIPGTVTSVESWAFGYCSNVKNLILEDGDTTLDLVRYSFAYINNEYLYLGRNVSSVSSSTDAPFNTAAGNTLKDITFGEKVTSLSTYQFYNCNAIEEVTIPSRITNFGNYIFYRCSGLETVTFEDGSAKVGDYMFYGCSALKNVTLPEGLTTIGSSAFRDCTTLEEITIPSNVTPSERAFNGCANLKNVTIREGVSAISNYMFYQCSSLTEIDLPGSIGNVGSYAFCYCTSLERVNFAEGEKSYYMGMHAFDHCSNLTSILLPKNVTYLGADALRYCESLKKFVIPNQTGNNGGESLRYNSALEEVILCAQAQSLSQYVASSQFRDCTNLSKLYVLSETAPGVANSNAFTNVPTETCTLYVPVGSKESYENNSYWKVFTNIEELSNPLPVTYCVGNVTSDSAQINGLVAVGSEGVTEVGFEYWAEGKKEEATTVAISNSFTTTSEINYTPTNLIYNTKYTYRVYAKTASDTFYGDEVTFTSKEATIVETLEAAEITDHSAVLYGNVVVPYFNTLEEKGFEYWLTEDDVQTIVVGTAGDGDFSADVTDLAYGTTYKYRTYAKIESGTVYGEELTFTTELYAPVIVTLAASDIAETSAVLNGTVTQGSEPITHKGFVYWSGDPNVEEVIIISDEDVEISYKLSSLTPETTYTYRVFATTDSGTTYGDNVVFKTLEDSTTGIDGISLDSENVEGIYSTSGQKLNTTVKGVNIIRYNDGTTKKIYNK